MLFFYEEHPSHPIDIVTKEMITIVHGIVFNYHQIKAHGIVHLISISCECVLNILHEHLLIKIDLQVECPDYSQ